MKVVIQGSKYDADDFLRLKLSEEYGRVWLCATDEEGVVTDRILCIDDDGLVRIAANHTVKFGELRLELPLTRRHVMKHDTINNKSVPEEPLVFAEVEPWRLKD